MRNTTRCHALAFFHGTIAPPIKGKTILLLIFLLTLLSCQARAQFTLSMPATNYRVSKTADGGFLYPFASNGGMAYAKYDSNATFQYGFQSTAVPGYRGSIQRHGKIFSLLAADNYFLDIAKTDMATGVTQVHKRLQGPVSGQGYFTQGPAQMIATQDSGLLIIMSQYQAFQIASVNVMHLKLDKYLNIQYTVSHNINSSFGIDNENAVENADGSITWVKNMSIQPYGNVLVVGLSSGITGTLLSLKGIYGASNIPAMTSLQSDPTQVIVAGQYGSADTWAMGMPLASTSVNWWKSYQGVGNMPTTSFVKGPNNTYFGILANTVVALAANGTVKWAKSADGGQPIAPKFLLGSNHILAAYSPSVNVGRVAVFDSTGLGLCSPTTVTPTVTNLNPIVVNLVTPSYSTLYFLITSLPTPTSQSSNPVTSFYCSYLCTLNAAFTANATGLSAAFTHQSNGATSHYWSFGDGGTSTLPNPSHAYAAPGTYTVCYIASNSCIADTICQQLTLSCTAPLAAFTSSSNGNVGTFTNTSTGMGNLSYSWTFGDGGTSTLASPNHTYAQPGVYNICLIVTSTCGGDTTCQSIPIGCGQTIAAFTSTSTLLAAQFTNTSTSQGPTTYAWSFGDGGSSTLAGPAHTYAQAGSYTVCLIVTSPCGSDTTCTPITIVCDPATAAFSWNASNLSTQFSSTVSGSGAITTFWTFGDGGNSTLAHPAHTYAQPGTYTVCLIATGQCGADTLCDTLHLTCPQLSAGISATGSFPTVFFSDLSIGNPITWSWDFGDGGSSTLQNPSHTYANPGNYNVCLSVADSCSQDSSCQQVSVLTGLVAPSWAGFRISPNPAKDRFEVHCTGFDASGFELRVYAADGRIVLQQQVDAAACAIDVHDWPAAVYWVQVRNASAAMTRMVVVGR